MCDIFHWCEMTHSIFMSKTWKVQSLFFQVIYYKILGDLENRWITVGRKGSLIWDPVNIAIDYCELHWRLMKAINYLWLQCEFNVSRGVSFFINFITVVVVVLTASSFCRVFGVLCVESLPLSSFSPPLLWVCLVCASFFLTVVDSRSTVGG